MPARSVPLQEVKSMSIKSRRYYWLIKGGVITMFALMSKMLYDVWAFDDVSMRKDSLEMEKTMGSWSKRFWRMVHWQASLHVDNTMEDRILKAYKEVEREKILREKASKLTGTSD